MTTTTPIKLSRRVRSPEDLCVGEFFTITHTKIQLLPDTIEPSVGGGEIELLRATCVPHDAGVPMKTIAVCLPFVIAEYANHHRVVIDTRRHALVKVDAGYAFAAKDKAQQEADKKAAKKEKGKGKKGKKK
ncbi:MAG: hypothetical protein ACE37H_13265 [Phycisphaeraceae bacterium]